MKQRLITFVCLSLVISLAGLSAGSWSVAALDKGNAAVSQGDSYAAADANAQLNWLVEAARDLPITAEEAEGHLSPALSTPEQLASLANFA